MTLHSAHVQIEKFSDLNQTLAVLVPQHKDGALPGRKLLERRSEPPAEVARGQQILGGSNVRRRALENGRLLGGRWPSSPELPAPRPQLVEARVDGNARQLFGRFLDYDFG